MLAGWIAPMRPAPNWQKLIMPVLSIMLRSHSRIERGAEDDHDPSNDGPGADSLSRGADERNRWPRGSFIRRRFCHFRAWQCRWNRRSAVRGARAAADLARA